MEKVMFDEKLLKATR